MTSDHEPKPLPPWFQGAGNAFILFHFIALGTFVLGASSFWGAMGEVMAPGPQFATKTNEVTFKYYLEPLRFTHNYHFNTNRTGFPSVKFEIRLYDSRGNIVKKLDFPESVGNPWVRHRLQQVTQNLSNDIPVEVRFGQVVPGLDKAGKPKKTDLIEIWAQDAEAGGQVYYLKEVTENEVPRTRFVSQPSLWSKKVAEAYIRYQFRLHGATVAEGELVRHSREAVSPFFLYYPNLLPANLTDFPEMKATFGKMKNETAAH